ncbi:hypothetical protein HHK36_011632 [Tetracentron sinense]|uniref:Uncharacterized protein n=1 Tax=Tetracentron sinense TaxID=13715 RepID=A0A835DHE0_TETSI|nr:hypothetical protein HHK36_011632 [Tetracentron sinense]
MFFSSETSKFPSQSNLAFTSSVQEKPSDSFYKILMKSKSDASSSSNLKFFSFNDLKIATKNFHSESLLGEGGFGWVLKGWILMRALLVPQDQESGLLWPSRNPIWKAFKATRNGLYVSCQLKF